MSASPLAAPRLHTRELWRTPMIPSLAATGVMTVGTVMPIPVLRAAIVVPIALLAPGYALVVALFGERIRLDAALGAALSLMLSLATYPLLALGLYALSVRLSTASILIATDGFIVAMALVAVLRGHGAAPTAQQPDDVPLDRGIRPGAPWSGPRGGLRFVAIVALVVGALAVAMPRLPRAVAAPYTGFSLSGAWAHVGTVVRADLHRPLVVAVAVANHTHRRQVYRLVARLDGAPWPARTVAVGVDSTWAGTVTGPVPADGRLHRLAMELSQPRSGHAVARLAVWVRGATPGRRW